MRTLAKLLTLGQTDTVGPHPAQCGLPNRYKILVRFTAALHIAIICYTAVGGFLALRWRRSFWLHLPAGLWGMAYVILYPPCPLSDLEHWARAKAGMPALPPEGFVGHYINVIYPASWMGARRPMAFVTALVPWALYLRGLRRNGST
jgi:hypothetical protein